MAALAYGTESVPRVDRIVGPGNALVPRLSWRWSGPGGHGRTAGAERDPRGRGRVGGPRAVAYDLLAQAEHLSGASAVLLTPSAEHRKSRALSPSSRESLRS